MAEPSGMDRRTLLARALMLVGAGAAASACQTLAPASLAAAELSVLNGEQLLTLTAVADTLVPRTDTAGALDVEVPGMFVALLESWAAPATRSAISATLDRIAALPAGGSFAALGPAARKAALQDFDAAALAPSGAAGGSPFGPPGAVDPDYQRLKELILTLYYMSQPALTQELAYTHVPGRWQPSIPVTAATRPQGGPGMF